MYLSLSSYDTASLGRSNSAKRSREYEENFGENLKPFLRRLEKEENDLSADSGLTVEESIIEAHKNLKEGTIRNGIYSKLYIVFSFLPISFILLSFSSTTSCIVMSCNLVTISMLASSTAVVCTTS